MKFKKITVVFATILFFQGCALEKDLPEVETEEALICIADCFHVPAAVVRNQCMSHCKRIDDIVLDREILELLSGDVE